ncbi:MAG: hypothetical protein WC586_05680 [Methanoregula sp.]
MICLALFGRILAGVHYYAADLPTRQNAALLPPENAQYTKCKNCQLGCTYNATLFKCLDNCDLYC